MRIENTRVSTFVFRFWCRNKQFGISGQVSERCSIFTSRCSKNRLSPQVRKKVIAGLEKSSLEKTDSKQKIIEDILEIKKSISHLI